jgi:hypothetical protein
MSRPKNVKTQEDPVVESIGSGTTQMAVEAPSAPVVNQKITDEDKAVMELAKSRCETVLAQAKEAAAKAETADISYRYVILQIYHKSGLSISDALSENGEIVRGGAIRNQQVK